MAISEELDLIIKAQAGDSAAEAQLLAIHNGWIHTIAWKHYRKLPYSAYRIDFNDIVQEVKIGLMIGIRKFDATKEVKLLTYATHWMNQKAQRLIRADSNTIRVPYRPLDNIDWDKMNAYSYENLTEAYGDAFIPGVEDARAYENSAIAASLAKILSKLDFHRELQLLVGKNLLETVETIGVVHEPCERCGKRTDWRPIAKERAIAKFDELCAEEGVSKQDFLDFLRDLA